jgi:hypothetical protein
MHGLLAVLSTASFSSFGKYSLVKKIDLKFQKLEIPSSSVLANTGPYWLRVN